MTRAHTLSLDDAQLHLVQQGARLLPPEVRDWYLKRVADALSNKAHPSDADVQRAITATLDRVPTTSVFLCDSKPKGPTT